MGESELTEELKINVEPIIRNTIEDLAEVKGMSISKISNMLLLAGLRALRISETGKGSNKTGWEF
jgi:hypothetical protein